MSGIIQAANIQSEIDRRELAGELDSEQATVLRRNAVYDTERTQLELQRLREQTQGEKARREHAQEQTISERTERPLRSEQIAAGTSAQLAQTASATELTAGRRQEREFAAKRYTIPNPYGGPPIEVSAETAAQYLGQVESRRLSAQNQRIDNIRQAAALQLQAGKDERSHAHAIDKASAEILATKPTMAEAAEPLMDFVNRESDNPYVWIHFPSLPQFLMFGPGAGTGDKWDYKNVQETIPPPTSGPTPTAREIFEIARKMNPPMTVKEYMEKVYYPKYVGKPAPWPHK